MIDLDRGAFRAWLAPQAPQSACGVSCDEENCPMAFYLTRTHTGLFVRVSRLTYTVGLQTKVLPAWAAAFVVQTDLDPASSITVAQALRILDDIAA